MNGKSYSTKKPQEKKAHIFRNQKETASAEICAEHSWVGRHSVKVHVGGAERIEPESLSEVQQKPLELEIKAYISRETTEIHWASLSRGSQCLELQQGK